VLEQKKIMAKHWQSVASLKTQAPAPESGARGKKQTGEISHRAPWSMVGLGSPLKPKRKSKTKTGGGE